MEALKPLDKAGELFSDSRGTRYYLSVVRGIAIPVQTDEDIQAARAADEVARKEWVRKRVEARYGKPAV